MMRETHACILADTDRRAALGSKLLATRNMVCMDMSFDHIGNREAVICGDFEVVGDIALWVDHGALARLAAANHIGEAAQSFQRFLMKEHCLPPCDYIPLSKTCHCKEIRDERLTRLS